MKKNNNLVASEMNKLLSNPSFGFNKLAESCCKSCGSECDCKENCPCRGECDNNCASCGSMDKKSYNEMFQLIITASDKLDSLGFERAATLLIKASDHLMQEVSDAHMADEGSSKLSPKAKAIFDAVVRQKEQHDSNDLDFDLSEDDTALERLINDVVLSEDSSFED